MELSTTIERGATVMVPISEILTWESIDNGGTHVHTERCVGSGSCWQADERHIGRTAWDSVLDGKREDSHYPDVVESLAEHGFVRPLTASLNSFVKKFGDGHHRLAAAIELGYTHVPIQFDISVTISNDSGSWYAGREIPTENEPY